MTTVLYERLRAQCCEISGLTAEQLDAHARQVAFVVNQARLRAARSRARSNRARPHIPARERDLAPMKGR